LHRRHAPSAQALRAASRRFPRAAQYGAVPRRGAFWPPRRRGTRPRSAACCAGLVREEDAPRRRLAPPELARRCRFSPRRPPAGFRSRGACPGAPPGVCGGRPLATIPPAGTLPGRPGFPTPLPPRVARPHRGALGWHQTPAPPSGRLDHAPAWADRCIPGRAPIADAPVVLRQPCRRHRAVDALPSTAAGEVAPGPPGRAPAFAGGPV
jgi:hypothetical protein